MRKRTANKKPSIWDNSARPYGINEGDFGSASQWKQEYRYTMGLDEAIGIVNEESPWNILGVFMDATLSEIKSAFRSLAKKLHPDVGGDAEKFKKVYAAYTILKDRVTE